MLQGFKSLHLTFAFKPNWHPNLDPFLIDNFHNSCLPAGRQSPFTKGGKGVVTYDLKHSEELKGLLEYFDSFLFHSIFLLTVSFEEVFSDVLTLF
jgi:hypothetical protein